MGNEYMVHLLVLNILFEKGIRRIGPAGIVYMYNDSNLDG